MAAGSRGSPTVPRRAAPCCRSGPPPQRPLRTARAPPLPPPPRQVLLFLTALSHSWCIFCLSRIVRNIEKYWAQLSTRTVEQAGRLLSTSAPHHAARARPPPRPRACAGAD